MDRAILEWIHSCSSPTLDVLFRVSHLLGAWTFCVPLVAALVAWHLLRRQPRAAAAWAVLGAATGLVPELIKALVGRPRPELWPHLVTATGASFPSGHATAGMALYPLLGWMALRSHPVGRRLGYVVGMLMGAFIGVGRLYLGVHWPSDVLAGWVLGLFLSAGAVAWLERKPPPPSLAGEASEG